MVIKYSQSYRQILENLMVIIRKMVLWKNESGIPPNPKVLVDILVKTGGSPNIWWELNLVVLGGSGGNGGAKVQSGGYSEVVPLLNISGKHSKKKKKKGGRVKVLL